MSNVTVNSGAGWIALIALIILFYNFDGYDVDLYDMIMLVLQNMADVASGSGDGR